MRIAVLILASLLVLWTALPLVRDPHWAIRIFDFPRQQILVLALMVFLLAALFARPRTTREWILYGLLLVASMFQAWQIFPFTPIAKTQVRTARTDVARGCFTTLISNVYLGNHNAQALLNHVDMYDPDLILVVEPDQWWLDQLRPLEGTYAVAAKHPLDNTYGLALYAKIPLDDVEVRFLVEDDIPSVKCRVLLAGGVAFTLYGLHPRPPAPGHAESSTERDAELLIVAREVKQNPGPAIVVGDLNDVAWSHTTRLFASISGMVDPRIGRGMFNTYHSQLPLLRWPLDHIFHTPDFTLQSLETLDDIGSDHYPVLARLCYEPEASHDQKPAPPKSDEQREAGEKIREGTNQEKP